MNSQFPEKSGERAEKTLEDRLESLALTVKTLAREQENDCYKLLMLLRTLEGLHREIRTEMFEPCLPDTRKALYGLLKDIEDTGGWPYIERMKLQSLMINLQSEMENPS